MEAEKSAQPWIVRYFREAKQELEKVAWPSRRDTLRYSLLVIGVSLGLAAIIAGLDTGLAAGFAKLLSVVAK